MKAFTKGLLLLLVAAGITGCSRKKNTFVNRNWHAVTAEYNTLYNGNLALDLGIEELNQTYRDNYWDILPVERMQVREEILLPETAGNPNFQAAEEKAIKAIQRHSMLIEGRERNPQIDEAYLLLGKARYYDQRFIPALEAFNYVLHKYPLSNSIHEAQVWREKTNIRLEFEELAIRNLKRVLEQETLDKDNKADAFAMLAQAYINLTHLDSAVAPIKKAAELTGDNDRRGRYFFITGQLYNRLGKKDSANLAFDEVISLNRRTPRIYMINAHIAQAQNRAVGTEDKTEFLELLAKMEQNRENRPFLDRIYFQLAEFHYQMDSVDLAVDYYNRSLRTPGSDEYLQSLDYQTLGNIYFDAANYKLAGAYYDSTLQRLPENTREFRLIRKKRENLVDVIMYEEIARTTDSILYLADLSEEERLDYFNRYIEELKENSPLTTAKDEPRPEEPSNFFENNRMAMPGVPNPGNAFYFYNQTAVAYGRQEFKRIWGNRPLTDNWRTGGTGIQQQESRGTVAADLAVEDNPMYDPETYLSQIPDDPAVLDSLVAERNMAWYQLGVIYREKFKEDMMAAEKLELVLQHNPEERLILPSKYYLYKIYSEAGDIARAQSLKNDIVVGYPESRYAAILQNSGEVLHDENSPEALYNELYARFEDQEYQSVIAEAGKLAQQFTGDPVAAKLELLRAMAVGRLLGFESYKEALNEVALNYPQSEEGRKAAQLYSEALPALADQSFSKDTTSGSYKLIFPFEKQERANFTAVADKLKKAIEELQYGHLQVSKDVYNPEQTFVVIHGFATPEQANAFAEMLSLNEDYRIGKNSFYISTPNYRIVQIHKNVDSYLESLTQTPRQ